MNLIIVFLSSRRRHTRYWRDWSSDVCSSDLLSEPRRLQKSARSVVSLGVSYYPGEHPENLEGEGRVARYAWGRDYHLVIKERLRELRAELDRKSTRLNSSHANISYAVFCLK